MKDVEKEADEFFTTAPIKTRKASQIPTPAPCSRKVVIAINHREKICTTCLFLDEQECPFVSRNFNGITLDEWAFYCTKFQEPHH